MNFFQSIDPRNVPPHMSISNELSTLREQVFQAIILSVSTIGSIGYLLIFFTSIKNKSWITISVASILFISLMLLALLRNIRYKLRVILFITLTLISGTLIFFNGGITSAGLIFLVVLTLICSLLLGLRAGFFALVFDLVILFLIQAGLLNSILTPKTASPLFFDNIWYVQVLYFLIFCLLGFIPSTILANSLQNKLKRQTFLTSDLEVERFNLEKKIFQSKQDTQRRFSQIRVINDLTTILSNETDIQNALQKIVDTLHERFNLYYAGIMLADENEQNLILKAGSGEPGKKMLAKGYKLAIGDTSRIGWVTANRKIRVTGDVALETGYFNNPNLPQTRSEMDIPLSGREKILGAITIHSAQPNVFSDDDVAIYQAISHNVSMAIENYQQFLQNQRLQDKESLHLSSQTREDFIQARIDNPDLSYTFENPHDNLIINPEKTESIPLILNQQNIGFITIENSTELDKGDLSLIATMVSHLTIAVDNARLINKTSKHANRDRKILEITSKIRSTTGFQNILQVTLRELQQALNISNGRIEFQNPTGTAKQDSHPQRFGKSDYN
jgi:GAF domain-containing protein